MRPCGNFTNILDAAFLYKVLRKAFLYSHFRYERFLAQEYWRNCAHKMLVKLTTCSGEEEQMFR
jgi:hypothetical protein